MRSSPSTCRKAAAGSRSSGWTTRATGPRSPITWAPDTTRELTEARSGYRHRTGTILGPAVSGRLWRDAGADRPGRRHHYGPVPLCPAGASRRPARRRQRWAGHGAGRRVGAAAALSRRPRPDAELRGLYPVRQPHPGEPAPARRRHPVARPGLLVLVGLGLLVPPLGHLIERPFYRFPQRALGTGRNGFLLGIALGAVFVPCAGPVLGAITVAGATGHIGLRTVGLTLGFAVGTAIPLLAFALAGRGLTQRLGAFRRHQGAFRAVSGAVVIVLAVALTFNLSDVIQRDIPNWTQALGNSWKRAPRRHPGAAARRCRPA